MSSLFDKEEFEILTNKKLVKKVSKTETKYYNYKMADPEELVKIYKKTKTTLDYSDFTKEQYIRSLNFYDFEVFQYDWMVVIINPVKKYKTLIVNDADALTDYFKKHKKEIWVGYNSRNYDTFILKSILLGMNPKVTNDLIIKEKMKGFDISEDFRDIHIYDYDVSNKLYSLKQYEAFMGNDIRETSVPFDLDRILTKQEIYETIKYCNHDVEQTIEVFRRKLNDWNAHCDLINLFDLPLSMISSTKARMTIKILGCEFIDWDDEFEIDFVNKIKLNKYKYIYDWFNNSKNMNYKKTLQTDVLGIPHQFGWGGLHGCIKKPVHITGKMFHLDVTSYYPSLMIEYNFLTRNSKYPEKYKQIYDKRVELKKAGKKKEQEPFKIIINSLYGVSKDKNSKAYDPKQANNVCVNGQLLLLDLLEHLEGTVKLIQSNTDGIIVQVFNPEQELKMRNICKEWMDRTKMGLGFDQIDEIWQGDVNNYVFHFTDIPENGKNRNKYERKGSYVKELSSLDYDLPIVNEAILQNLIHNVPVEETINNCDDMIMFQKIYKISKNYAYAWHNGNELSDKTFRVFASTRHSDSFLGKVKFDDTKIEKFSDCPEHCFIYNDDVKNMKVLDILDKKYYIDLVYRRLDKKFGVKKVEQFSLF